jgi:hypothetical protein
MTCSYRTMTVAVPHCRPAGGHELEEGTKAYRLAGSVFGCRIQVPPRGRPPPTPPGHQAPGSSLVRGSGRRRCGVIHAGAARADRKSSVLANTSSTLPSMPATSRRVRVTDAPNSSRAPSPGFLAGARCWMPAAWCAPRQSCLRGSSILSSDGDLSDDGAVSIATRHFSPVELVRVRLLFF